VNVSSAGWNQAELLDITGKVIMTANSFSEEIRFKTDTLSAGVYIVRMLSENKNSVKKVIKE
jgi:hypothetical protein